MECRLPGYVLPRIIPEGLGSLKASNKETHFCCLENLLALQRAFGCAAASGEELFKQCLWNGKRCFFLMQQGTKEKQARSP